MSDLLKAWVHNVMQNPFNDDQLEHAKATKELINKLEIAVEALEILKVAVNDKQRDISAVNFIQKTLEKIRGEK